MTETPEPDAEMARPASWAQRDSLNSLLPVGAFLLLNNLFGLAWAIVGTTAGSLYALWDRHRRGIGIGMFIPITAAVLISRAVIGIIYDSENVYFGTGIVLKFLVAVGLVASVVVGKNVVGWGLPFGLPLKRATTEHPIYESTTARLTLLWAAYLVVSGVFDIWLLAGASASANQFVVVRFFVSWVVTSAAIFGAMLWAAKKFDQIPGFEGLMPLIEQQYGVPIVEVDDSP